MTFLLQLLIAALSYGCASSSTVRANLGILPDHPDSLSEKDSQYELECRRHNGQAQSATKDECVRFYAVDKWAHDRETAYRKKAALNINMYYVAAGIGVVAGTIVTALTATEKTDSDALKLTPPIAAGLAGLAALMQNEEKAEAYLLSVAAINEAIRAAERGLGAATNLDERAYRIARQSLEDALHQEMLNLQKRLAAIVKHTTSSIGKFVALTPDSTDRKADTTVTITVDNIDLQSRLQGELAVTLDYKPAGPINNLTKNSFQFTLPLKTRANLRWFHFMSKTSSSCPLGRSRASNSDSSPEESAVLVF